MREMMSKYDILKAISKGELATLQSIYSEIERWDTDADSLIDEIVSLVSEGLIEEQAKGRGVITYALTASGKRVLEAIGKEY